ncbi:UvrD-helicase domain-containing protein [Haladaptatus sp. ZSTT2]|uniref:UvrD-helicase domain-containing protein n=1 Tax=Haladaptatus sp. ZSTT2 TaxID=3120515 RepID=UPI00300ED75B
MSEISPNPRQQELIDATDGIHLVDAGAGTGKTFAITHRYANILSQDKVEPADVLLFTFTNNAAAEMRERIVNNCDYSMAALRDAPISTFHAHCHQLLLAHGFNAPNTLGIEDHITSSTQLIEESVLEKNRFREFIQQFADSHPEYHEQLQVLNSPLSLLDLIGSLAAKGIYPEREGWYRHGEEYLDGDFDAFQELFIAANEPNQGASGPTQSDLRAKLSGWGKNCYLSDAPAESQVRGDWGDKQIDAELAEQAFFEDRKALKQFVHDVYFQYIEYALSQNYLTFWMLLMFTYSLLCEDHTLREDLQHEYVMIDEFQDTNEIQFKLSLLFANRDNFCVVGDWKQSIYGFQYAAVENIQEFESRLTQYKEELNSDAERISFPVTPINTIPLNQNYRSSQSILDFSEHALTLPASSDEDIGVAGIQAKITSLETNLSWDESSIEAVTCSDELEGVLEKIQSIVGNPAYAVKDEGEWRSPTYQDIAVLTRIRRFGRQLQHTATDYNIPVAYEGGLELFDTDHALLLLAWLRILESPNSRRGWAVVLEQTGYNLDEIRHILDTESYPDVMIEFREDLLETESIGGLCRRVFTKYGLSDAYSDTLISVLESINSSTYLNRGEIIHFIEQSHGEASTQEVDDDPGGNSVTVQTIHAAKGLEHPIVILANINQSSFPPSGGGSDSIRFAEPIGIRQSKIASRVHGSPHVYGNWRYDILNGCLQTDYDEERRLMYVAMTRAKFHLIFSASKNPSPFFENLPVDPVEITGTPSPMEPPEEAFEPLSVTIPETSRPVRKSAHDLMAMVKGGSNGMGPEFGTQVHDFAETLVKHGNAIPTNSDEEHVKSFLYSLTGELVVEKPVFLPVHVNGTRVTITGTVDLLHIQQDCVDIIDYKTDRGRHAENEYRKQLSIYYHVISDVYPEKEITPTIFYTELGTEVSIDPLSKSEIEALAANTL